MSSKLDPQTLTQVIASWEQWQSDRGMETVLAFIAQYGAHEPIKVVTADQGDIDRGSAVLAAFTARAAMRKVMLWYQKSTEWSAEEKHDYLVLTVRELQDAIQNCNTALYYLAGPGAAQIGGDRALEAFLNGGEK